MRAPNALMAPFMPEEPPIVQVAIPESYYDGLDPNFAAAVRAMDAAAPPGIYEDIGAISGYRSVDHQRRLWESALQRYGSPEAARRWVAPPGNSRHNSGLAMDLSYGSDAAREWVHENAEQFGLHFPMSWENWHIEPVGPDGGRIPMGSTAAPYDPTRPPSVFNPPPGSNALSPDGAPENDEERERNRERERQWAGLDPRMFMSRRDFTFTPVEV
jgi:hypothetical protein